MKKIGKIFLILCVLFSQFSGVLRVYAEENNNNMIEEDNNNTNLDEDNTENDGMNQEVTDGNENENNNKNDNVAADDTDNNNNVINEDDNTNDDTDNNTGDNTDDGNNNTTGDDIGGNTGDNTGDGNTTGGEIEMHEVVVGTDTATYDDGLNDSFNYNGTFNEGTLFLIGSFTVSDIVNSFDDVFVTNSEGEVYENDETIVDGDFVYVVIDNKHIEYGVVILGDDDGSGTVDNADVESVINNLFNDPDYFNPVVDIEGEGIITVYDVSKLHYAVNNKEKSEIVATPVLTPILSVDNDTLNIGDTVKISLSVSGLESYSVNTISGRVSFDSSILSFSSASSEDGEVYFDEETASFIAVGEFKEGSTIDIEFVAESVSEEEYVTFWDLITLYDGVDFELESNQVSVAVSITAENNKGGDVEETTTEPAPAPAPAVPVVSPRVTYVSRVLSSDCKILDLKVKGYEIDFDPDTYEYHIKVGNKVKSLDIEVILSDSNASYVINGNEDFKEGENVVTVVVTAEDGSTKTYTLIVDKEKAKEVVEDKDSNISRYIVIGLIVLVIAGLIYLIFKDDEEDNK